MASIQVLIDLANANVYRGIHRPNPVMLMTRLAERLTAVCDALLEALPSHASVVHDMYFRLYDGWFDEAGSATEVHRMLYVPIRRDYPTRSRRYRLFVNLAESIAGSPELRVIHTARTEEGLPRVVAALKAPAGSHPLGCVGGAASCTLPAVQAWLRGKCPTPLCPVEASDALTYKRQKLVDTMLTADAIWYASQGHAVAVMTDDEDIVPGLLTAVGYGSAVFWVSTKATPRLPYLASLARASVRYVECS